MKFAFGLVCGVAVVMTAACGGGETVEQLEKQDVASEDLSSDCAGIMPPSAPASWTQILPGFATVACGPDTSDASGNVILEHTQQNPNFEAVFTKTWDIFTTVGHARGRVDEFGQIFAQEWGFQTVTRQVRAFTANGALIRSTALTFATSDAQVDLAGGVVVAGLRPQQPFTIVVQRFDPHSNPLAPQAVVARGTTRPSFIATGVSMSGLTLVLWNGEFSGFPANTVVGRWLDRFGQARTGTFLVARNATMAPGGAIPLIDGSMAIRGFVGLPEKRTWLAIVHPGSTAVSAVPSWLATRPEARVFIVRGGRAYALVFPHDPATEQRIPPIGEFCGSAHVALFAPAGTRCGGFDVDSGAPDPTCAIVANIGRDGSLMVAGRAGSDTVCKHRVFPALLK